MAPHISFWWFILRLRVQSKVGAELIGSIAVPDSIANGSVILILSITDPFAIQRIRGRQASPQHGPRMLIRIITAAARAV